jgi:hypothetical protein
MMRRVYRCPTAPSHSSDIDDHTRFSINNHRSQLVAPVRGDADPRRDPTLD